MKGEGTAICDGETWKVEAGDTVVFSQAIQQGTDAGSLGTQYLHSLAPECIRVGICLYMLKAAKLSISSLRRFQGMRLCTACMCTRIETRGSLRDAVGQSQVGRGGTLTAFNDIIYCRCVVVVPLCRHSIIYNSLNLANVNEFMYAVLL